MSFGIQLKQLRHTRVLRIFQHARNCWHHRV